MARVAVKDPERYVRRVNAAAQKFREKILDELAHIQDIDPVLRDRAIVVLDLAHPLIRMLATRPGALSTIRPRLSHFDDALDVRVRHTKSIWDELTVTLRIERHSPHVAVSVSAQFASPQVVDRITLGIQAKLRDAAALPRERTRRPHPWTAIWNEALADQVLTMQATDPGQVPQVLLELLKTSMVEVEVE